MYGYLSLGFLALSLILLVIEYNNKSIKMDLNSKEDCDGYNQKNVLKNNDLCGAWNGSSCMKGVFDSKMSNCTYNPSVTTKLIVYGMIVSFCLSIVFLGLYLKNRFY